MATIPPSGEACPPPQSIAVGLSPGDALISAMMAKAGEARSASPSARPERHGWRTIGFVRDFAAAGVAHGLTHDLALADWSRNAFSPASDTSIHLWSGAASAT